VIIPSAVGSADFDMAVALYFAGLSPLHKLSYTRGQKRPRQTIISSPRQWLLPMHDPRAAFGC
jgi:hypothetical protein